MASGARLRPPQSSAFSTFNHQVHEGGAWHLFVAAKSNTSEGASDFFAANFVTVRLRSNASVGQLV